MNVLMSEMLSRFFKTGPGQYGEGDRFLGIKVPLTRAVVKDCWRETDFADLEACIASGYHEPSAGCSATPSRSFPTTSAACIC